MKKVLLIFSFFSLTQQLVSQTTNEDLPDEFKKIAKQAFQQLTPANQQWFIETAKQQPGNKFDTAWARKKINEKFGVNTSENVGELFAVMLAYQKLLAREERADKKIKEQSRDIAIQSKDEKLKVENKKIDEMKTEAGEKADQQMTAAQTQMWIGIVAGIPAAASASGSQKQSGNSLVNKNQVINPVTVKQTDSLKSRISNVSSHKENEKDQVQVRTMDDAIKKLQSQLSVMNKYLRP